MQSRIGKASTWRRVGRLFKYLLGLLGVAFLVVAFAGTWRRSQGLPIPKLWAFVLAAFLVLAGLGCLSRSWVGLLQDEGIDRSLAAAFYTSQLGRYIPGAIWQILAQVGLATQAGASLPQASTALGVFTLVEVAAGGTVGATLALFGAGLQPIVRISALLMLIPLLFLQRRWIARALHLMGRLTRRRFADDLVPGQRVILLSYFWTLTALIVYSLAFALLLASLPGGSSVLRSLAAFGFAWTLGFLAIPFPSGIGIREAVLMFTVGPGVPRSYVIAASIAQRLITMVCELIMIVTSRISARAHAGLPDKTTSTGDTTESTD